MFLLKSKWQRYIETDEFSPVRDGLHPRDSDVARMPEAAAVIDGHSSKMYLLPEADTGEVEDGPLRGPIWATPDNEHLPRDWHPSSLKTLAEESEALRARRRGELAKLLGIDLATSHGEADLDQRLNDPYLLFNCRKCWAQGYTRVGRGIPAFALLNHSCIVDLNAKSASWSLAQKDLLEVVETSIVAENMTPLLRAVRVRRGDALCSHAALSELGHVFYGNPSFSKSHLAGRLRADLTWLQLVRDRHTTGRAYASQLTSVMAPDNSYRVEPSAARRATVERVFSGQDESEFRVRCRMCSTGDRTLFLDDVTFTLHATSQCVAVAPRDPADPAAVISRPVLRATCKRRSTSASRFRRERGSRGASSRQGEIEKITCPGRYRALSSVVLMSAWLSCALGAMSVCRDRCTSAYVSRVVN